ncbi:MAG: VWA domain-containing protein, partial [Pyrinomonadaceae bacterium]|nr:VWA domain-containing protein [Pyrinomonadaceae bacterium]
MRKFAVLFVLLALVLSSLQAVTAQQTRPRRVGQTAPTGSAPTQTPSTPTAQTGTRRPPVLGGANNTTGRTDPASTAAGVPAKDEPIELGEGDTLRISTNLVTVPVSVTDRNGKYVPNLRKEDFRVYEDGVEQEVAYFASVEKPFTVALLLDTSVSTRNNLTQIQDEAIAFVNQLRPDDRVMVVSFDNRIRVLAEPTSDRYLLRNAIQMTEAHAGTKLYDAIDLVINQRFNRISGRKAIVVFTDGVDTTSRAATYESTVRDAEELDALIYPIRFDTYDATVGTLGGGGGGGGPRTVAEILAAILSGRNVNIGNGGGEANCKGCSREEYARGEAYLHELAQRTGTRVEEAGDGRNLSQAFSIIAEELRRQYSIGYYPNNQAQAGQRRQIRVRVNKPNMAVRARDSYIMSDQQSTDQYQNS